MTQPIELTTEWKILLESRRKSDHLTALIDIVVLINCEDVKENLQLLYLTLINSEMCHYFAELLIYKWKKTTHLINKIICHLSEHEKFFKYDFYKILRGYLRLINSFPLKIEDNQMSYRNSILATASIIIKRALRLGLDFNDKRVSAICLLLSANTASLAEVDVILTLDYISLVFTIMSSIDLSEKDKNYQNTKIIEIIQAIPFRHDHLSNEFYFIFSLNVLDCTLNLLSETSSSTEENMIRSILIEKFMSTMEFVIDFNVSIFNYECFCNMLYVLLTSKKLQDESKLLILNRFFILDGHNLLIKLIDSDVAPIKSRIIFAEIIFNFLKIFHSIEDQDKKLSQELREKVFNDTFNADLCYENHLKQTHEPSGETMEIWIIKCYIDTKWKKEIRSRGEILSVLTYFLEIIKRRKIKMDNGVFVMIVSLYTSNFVKISIKENNLLETSSSTIMKYYKRFNVVIDLKFLQWWLQNNTKSSLNDYKRLIMQYIITANEELDELCEEDLYIFDLNFIIKIFFESTTLTRHNYRNLAKIISRFSLNSRYYEKFMKFYENKMLRESDCGRSTDLLEIMCINATKISPRLKKLTLILMHRVINAMRENIYERTMAIQLSVVTLSSKMKK